MRCWTLLLGCLGTLGCASATKTPAVPETKKPFSGALDVTFTGTSRHELRCVVAPGHMRCAGKTGDAGGITLVDVGRKRLCRLSSRSPGAPDVTDRAALEARRATESKPAFVRTGHPRTVAGHACIELLAKESDGEIVVCIAPHLSPTAAGATLPITGAMTPLVHESDVEGIALVVEAKSQAGELVFGMEVTRVDEGPVDAKVFDGC